MRRLALALACGDRPIIIEGPAGCGKTSIAKHVARLLGYDDVVAVHVDDQMDGKSLIGSYVCTDTPGEFKWQPGALSIAVMTGKLVLLEDIDKAPPDVLATLIPLLENRKLPGKNLQHATAHNSFKFIATRCIRPSASGAPKRVPPIVQAVRVLQL